MENPWETSFMNKNFTVKTHFQNKWIKENESDLLILPIKIQTRQVF